MIGIKESIIKSARKIELKKFSPDIRFSAIEITTDEKFLGFLWYKKEKLIFRNDVEYRNENYRGAWGVNYSEQVPYYSTTEQCIQTYMKMLELMGESKT